MDDKAAEQQIETETRALVKEAADHVVKQGVPYPARTGAERDVLARWLAERLVREQGRKGDASITPG